MSGPPSPKILVAKKKFGNCSTRNLECRRSKITSALFLLSTFLSSWVGMTQNISFIFLRFLADLWLGAWALQFHTAARWYAARYKEYHQWYKYAQQKEGRNDLVQLWRWKPSRQGKYRAYQILPRPRSAQILLSLQKPGRISLASSLCTLRRTQT